MSIAKANFPGIIKNLKNKLNEIIDAVNSLTAGYVTLTGTQTLTSKTLTAPTINGGVSSAMAAVTGYPSAGAITISNGVHVITGTAATAMTLAAPSTAQNGTILTIMSSTAFAHTITFTGGTLVDGTSSAHTTATCAAYAGATISVVAYGGKWYKNAVNGMT